MVGGRAVDQPMHRLHHQPPSESGALWIAQLLPRSWILLTRRITELVAIASVFLVVASVFLVADGAVIAKLRHTADGPTWLLLRHESWC